MVGMEDEDFEFLKKLEGKTIIKVERDTRNVFLCPSIFLTLENGEQIEIGCICHQNATGQITANNGYFEE